MSDLHLPRATAATDAAPDVADDGAPRCIAIRPPPPPPSNPETTGGDDPKNDILVAVRRVIPTAESSQIGYDIDGVCTCDPAPTESCAVRRGTTLPHCDSDGGRDNALTELLKALQPILQFDILDYTNERLRTAAVGFLFKVTNYNGKLDDAEVDVSAYGSLGPAVVDDQQDAGYSKYYPRFGDGGVDTWSIDRSNLEDEATLLPRVRGKAYVSGGVIVLSSLESIEFPLISEAKTRFNGGVITGRIQLAPNGQGSPKLDSLVLAGRWHTTDFLTAIARLEDPRSPPKGLCDDPTFALLAKGFVCPRADVASSPASDNKNAACEAVSVGIGFEMVPALIGPVVDPPLSTDRCGDASFSCDPTN